MTKFTKEDFERLAEAVTKYAAIETWDWTRENKQCTLAALRIASRAVDREKLAVAMVRHYYDCKLSEGQRGGLMKIYGREADALIAMFEGSE